MDRNCIDESSSDLIDDTAAESYDISSLPAAPRIICCDNCGAKCSETARFCTNCGAMITGGYKRASVPPVPEKEGKNYGILSLFMLAASLVCYILSGSVFQSTSYYAAEVSMLLSVAAYIGAALLAVKTMINCRKNRTAAKITLALIILPLLIVIVIAIIIFVWFAQHPDYEP